MPQLLSAVVGAVVSEVVGGIAQSGASIAASGMKNNEDYLGDLKDMEGNPNLMMKVDKYGNHIYVSNNGLVGILEIVENSAGDIKVSTLGDINLYDPDLLPTVANLIGDNFDRSDWADNELSTITISQGFGKKKVLGIDGSLGFAMDQAGNVYFVMSGSGGLSVDLSDLNISDIIKFIPSISTEIPRGKGKMTKLESRKYYSKLSFSINHIATGVQVSVSDDSACFGINKDIMSTNVDVVYLKPIN